MLITKYETPGGQEFADTILPFVHRTNVMILANHGTVSYGETVEQAYWWTEILDSYCRMLMLSRQLGNVSYLSGEKSQELLDLKDKWGYKDPRNTPEYDNCDICANDVFRDSWAAAGVERPCVSRSATGFFSEYRLHCGFRSWALKKRWSKQLPTKSYDRCRATKSLRVTQKNGLRSEADQHDSS